MGMIYNFLFQGKGPVWTAIFTGALVVFSGLLWHVSSDMNDSSQASARAFLSMVSNPQLESVVTNGKVSGYRVHVAWLNNGTTPAKTAVAQFNIADSPDRPQRGLDFSRLPQSERQEYVLGPKGAWEVTTVPLSFETVSSIQNGRHVFAWGWVVYRDIFKGTPPRVSEFCFELTNPSWNDPDHTKLATVFHVGTPPCPIYNCYDENCEDYEKLSEEIK